MDDFLRPVSVVTRATPAGKVLLVASLVALLLGGSGFGVAFALFAALGVAFFAVAAIASRRRVASLLVRPPGPSTANARERFVLGMGVARPGGTSFDLVASFRDARDGRKVAGFLPGVGSGAEATLEAVHPALRRGRHRPGALELESSGPLGLVVCRASFDLPHDVLVLPRLGTLRGLDRDVSRHREASAPTARGRAGGEEFHELRGWREGEGLRRVHWKASARRGRLVVRELRGVPQPPVHVILVAGKTDATRGAAADFEGAVALAATLVERHVRGDHPVRMTIVGRDVRTIPCRRGRNAVLAALRGLADVEAVPASECRALAEVPRDGRPGERTFVARVGGVGGAAPVPHAGARSWRVLDLADRRIGAVFSRVRAGDSVPTSVGPGGDSPTSSDVARGCDRALRAVAWTAIAAATLAVLVAGVRLLFPGGRGVFASADAAPRAVLAAVLVLTAAFQALSAWMRGDDRAVLVRALWTTQSLALVAAAVSDSLPAFVPIPVVVAALLAGLSLAHAAAVRERVVRALRGRAAVAEAPATVRRRTLAGAALALPVIAFAALLFPPATVVPGLVRSGWSRMTGESAAAATSDAAPVGGRASRGTASVVIDPTAHGMGAGDLGNRLLLEIVPTRNGRPSGNLGPLYLRGAVLVEVDERGSWIDSDLPPPPVRDGDDGRSDGWCTLRPRSDGDVVYLDMRQVPLEHGATGLSILHAPPGTLAVERPSVLHEPEGPILSASERRAPHSFRLRTLTAGSLPWPTDATPRAFRDPRALDFPARHSAAAELASAARETTDGHTTDLARVRAVVRHLRETYEYERLADAEDTEDGADPLERFVATRRGSCVEFAQAAALMLRSRGIPTRVATGLLVREWNPERGQYRAFGRDYHAWVEVDFEGCGWVVFDATPIAPAADAAEEGAAAAARRREMEGPGALESVVRFLEEGADVAAAAIRRLAWPWGLVSLVATVVIGLVLARRRGDAVAAPLAADRADSSSWGSLLRRLARRGHLRAPTETALEFAARVVAAEGDRLAGFVPLTLRQQAARYGARELSDDDERAIDALRRSV